MPLPRLEWAPIPAPILSLDLTLTSGQAFRWAKLDGTRWFGSVGRTVAVLEPHPSGFGWATWPPGRWDAIARYFGLEVDLEALYAEWIARDPEFAPYIRRSRGLRILRQTPETALISFICSSCNNVPRIARMLDALASAVGDRSDCPWMTEWRFDADLSGVARLSEQELRDLGFGYRARFLAQVASPERSVSRSWFERLATLEPHTCRQELMTLPGVGAKVADCVRLFGLAHDDAVPVDTHLRRYITRRLAPDLCGRSMTATTYDMLASRLRGIMGAYAGWAQQYVFVHERRNRSRRDDHER